MKTKLFFITLISLLTIKPGGAQVNDYFNNNPVWRGHSVCAVPYPCIQTEDYSYYLNGDTIINSLVYKKIYKSGLGDYQWFSSPPIMCSGTYSFINTNPEAFLRSAGKQVYIIIPGSSAEQLLYDFNLSLGDTLPLSYINFSNDIYVTSVDSVNTPNGFLKVFGLDGNFGAQFLVEGAGASTGLLEPIGPILECGYDLVCYSLNGTTYYPSGGPACNIVFGIDNPVNKLQSGPYPNPFTTYSTVKFNVKTDQAVMNVFNSFGQKVNSVGPFSSDQLLISRGNLSSGVYFYEVLQDNEKVSDGKLIIIE
jgi:hypothetical protein